MALSCTADLPLQGSWPEIGIYHAFPLRRNDNLSEDDLEIVDSFATNFLVP